MAFFVPIKLSEIKNFPFFFLEEFEYFLKNGEGAILEVFFVYWTKFQIEKIIKKKNRWPGGWLAKEGTNAKKRKKLSLNVFQRLKISSKVNDFFVFFFEGWPTISSKNGTNYVFNKMMPP
jgi:hypothetical protein